MSLGRKQEHRPSEQQERESQLVDNVVASFDACQTRGCRSSWTPWSRHLHAFIREVRLTEEEWETAIDFLTEAGHITDDRRQEFILLSDVLGASMQTITSTTRPTRTPPRPPSSARSSSRTPPTSSSAATSPAAPPGEPCWVEGTVTDTDGTRSPARASRSGRPTRTASTTSSTTTTGSPAGATSSPTTDGRYRFWALTPTPYPIPDDGPVGRMLDAVGRSPMRASTCTSWCPRRRIAHAGHAHLPPRRRLLVRDTVFGVKDSLVKEFEPQPAGTPTPDGRVLGNGPGPGSLRHRPGPRQRVVSVQTRQWLAMRKGVPAMPTKVYLYDAVRTWFGTHGGACRCAAERPAAQVP